MLSQPPTMNLSATLYGREGALERAVAAARQGKISLCGPAGVGTSALAAGVAAALMRGGDAGGAHLVRITPWTQPEDATRALGIALGLSLPGDEASLQRALDREERIVVVLDDADLAPQSLGHLLRLGPRVFWIATGRTAALGEAIAVSPLSDEALTHLLPEGVAPAPFQGNPLLATLARHTGDSTPQQLLAGRPAALQNPWSAAPQDGTPWTHEASGAPRRAVLEWYGLGMVPDPEALGAGVLRERAHLIKIATGSPEAPSHQAVMRLRQAARLPDPESASLAGAAAARQLMRFSQVPEAIALIYDLLERPEARSPLARGLLYWVQGDALLLQGAEHAARLAHEDAFHALRAHSDQTLVVTLAAGCAQTWAARGQLAVGRRWIAQLRELEPTSPAARREREIVEGELALLEGAPAAEALLEEAAAGLGGQQSPRRAGVHLALASAHLRRRRFAEAREELLTAERLARGDPQTLANLSLRKAEVAATTGHLSDASSLAGEAYAQYRNLGCVHGMLLTYRLRGDVLALGGDRPGAMREWSKAIRLCLRTRNLLQLERILHRVIAVEEEGAGGPHLEELQASLREVRALRSGPASRGPTPR
ncbi:MAG: hypothetical protein JXX28_10720 [Deltaproteobacteria bacterium]|nr:hypothetical protein [Deltaproteobacteria bacterium]